MHLALIAVRCLLPPQVPARARADACRCSHSPHTPQAELGQLDQQDFGKEFNSKRARLEFFQNSKITEFPANSPFCSATVQLLRTLSDSSELQKLPKITENNSV